MQRSISSSMAFWKNFLTWPTVGLRGDSISSWTAASWSASSATFTSNRITAFATSHLLFHLLQDLVPEVLQSFQDEGLEVVERPIDIGEAQTRGRSGLGQRPARGW